MGTLSETTNMQASVLAGIAMLIVSTMGTSTIEESLVDVSLANTTGEIKIKRADPYFYLVVKASKRPRYTDSRNARLFLLVNGKVPQGGWDPHREPHDQEPQPHDAPWYDRLLH